MIEQFLTQATPVTQPAPTGLANLPTAVGANALSKMKDYVIIDAWKNGSNRALKPTVPDGMGGNPRPLVNAVYLGFFPHSGSANQIVVKLWGYNFLTGTFAEFSNNAQLTIPNAQWIPIENPPSHLIIYPQIVSVAGGDTVDGYIASDPMCPLVGI